MITVDRLGTFGNNMFEYAIARILAEKLKLKLKCSSDIDDSVGSAGFTEETDSSSWIEGFPNAKREIDGDVVDEPAGKLPRYVDIDSVTRGRIYIQDFMDSYDHVKNHREDLKKWFETDVKSPIEVGPNDVVLSIRRGWCNSSPTVAINRGGCWPVSLCPPGSFFLKLLEKIDYERIILCTDSFDDPYFEFLDELDCEVIKANFSGIEQYALIKSANKIILSASTFCWWAAWLSDATEIYYPWIENLTSWCGALENPMGQPDGKGGPYIFVKSDLLSNVVSSLKRPDTSPQSTAPKGALSL